jgi:hypothetical protein
MEIAPMSASTSIIPSNPTSGSIAIPDADDPWAAQAAEGGGQLGKLLKFSKAHWYQGENEVATGTEFVALMRDAALGDVRWAGGKPVEMRLAFIRDHAKFADRASLGYLDKEQWETDAKGDRRDPWQRQWFLPLLHTESGELYCWAFSSHGARSAFKGLCGSYSPHRKTNRLPVVSLQSSHYRHDRFGRIDLPVLKIERWESYGGALGGVVATDDPISTGRPSSSDDMDDAIPF